MSIEKLDKQGGPIMAATIIGRVRSGSGRSYEVKWDQLSKDVYVSWGG